MATSKDHALIGSGHCYVAAINESTVDLSDVDTLITKYFVDANRWGHVKNGATITYTPTTQSISDDLGEYKRVILTAEDLTFNIGTMTVTNKLITDLIETGRDGTSSTAERHVIKIGGIAQATGKNFFIGFHHIDKLEGDIYFMFIGKNSGELTIGFTPDDAGVVSPTFTASAMDEEGTLGVLVIEDPATE